MIGYISSAGRDGDTSNAEITVIYADDFSLGIDAAPAAVYTYNRISGVFMKISDTESFGDEISYGQLCAIVELLKLEETKSGMAMKVFWRDNFALGPEVLRSEYQDGVWLPAPVLVWGCEKNCLNITQMLYDYAPTTLEVSFLCDVLNMLFCRCEIKISAPFYCMYNSIFVSFDALRLFYDIFSDDLFCVCPSSEYAKNLKRMISGEEKSKENIEKITKSLEALRYEEKEYQGTRHNFAINIKRSCIGDITALLISGIRKEIGFGALLKELTDTVSSYVSRFVTLSELFVVSGNLERANDVKFLTLYELMSAFAFAEKMLTLKSAVRKGKDRIAHINKTKIPCTVFYDGRCI